MNEWKGIILAGGSGTRLFPLTHVVNKHLLPVYDKPMIYYPLTTLMLSGLRDFVIITNAEHVDQFKALLGDGSRWGIRIEYLVQLRAEGVGQSLIIAEHAIAGRNVALALGDNIFYGSGLPRLLNRAMTENVGATIFGYEVSNPSAYGVVTLDGDGRALALEEKPAAPQSRLAVPGLYFYDRRAVGFARELTPSGRGELEITDVNRRYLAAGDLKVRLFGRGMAWLDGGTHRDLFEASQFVKVLEERTGLKVACPEEIAWRMGFIDQASFERLVDPRPTTDYQRYLHELIRKPPFNPE